MKVGPKKLLAIIFILSAVEVAVNRRMEIPTNLVLYVRLDLWRNQYGNGGFIEEYGLYLSAEKSVSHDNVSFLETWGDGHAPTEDPWLIAIQIDETSQRRQWEYAVLPKRNVAGRYNGTVIHAIDAQGEFRLSILLHGHTDGVKVLKDYRSELVSTGVRSFVARQS